MQISTILKFSCTVNCPFGPRLNSTERSPKGGERVHRVTEHEFDRRSALELDEIQDFAKPLAVECSIVVNMASNV